MHRLPEATATSGHQSLADLPEEIDVGSAAGAVGGARPATRPAASCSATVEATAGGGGAGLKQQSW